MQVSRRQVLGSALASMLARGAAAGSSRLKIVVAGGHPGDPECGCAGTVARYAALGHEVVLLYLNRGEGFCKGGGADQCASIRTAEAQKACRILHATAAFARQIDGRAVVDNAQYEEFSHLLTSLKPDIVFAQWPIDQHRDHRAVSLLAFDAWQKAGRTSALYYFEVAGDTQMFAPNEYVDISAVTVEELRRAACYAHASQQPEQWYPEQVELTRFRGSQSGHAQAEAFARHPLSVRGLLP